MGLTLRRFAELERWQRDILIESTVALVMARLTLLVTPFAKVAGRHGRPGAPPPPTEAEQSAAAQVRWGVETANRHLPFRSVCLPKAIAARSMLRRRGLPATLHFGARRCAVEGMQAHAWLESGGQEVTGYPVDPEITEIACFT